MKVELRKNGELQIRIQPTDGIEQVILDSMVAKAQQGATVRLAKSDECAVFSMEAE